MDDHAQLTKHSKVHGMVSEDGTLKYDFMISLQNIVIVKIINNLWMNQTTQQDIMNLFHSYTKSTAETGFSYRWQQIKNCIFTKVSELPLPNSLTEKLANVVPFVGEYIINWIKYNDEHIFNTTEFSAYSAVDLIGNITWTTRGKIDYAQTAKNMLSNQDSYLNDDHKYKIACTYCLEDEINIIAPNIVNPYYLSQVYIDIHPMVYFWTTHITGDNTKLYSPSYYDSNRAINIENLSINQNIFRLLTNNDNAVHRTLNEIPIKYMWTKLNEEEKAQNVKSLIVKLDNQDLRYALLSNLNYEQQQKVFKGCSGTILLGLFNDWLWKEYFLPTALHVLDIMNPLTFLWTLREVNKEMIKNSRVENKYAYDQYKSIFKQLWIGGCKCLENTNVFENENGNLLMVRMIFSFSWYHDMDVIELLFRDLSVQQRRRVIFGYHGIRRCAHFIQNDQWDLLELLIKYTLSSEDDVSQLKQRLIKDKGHETAVYFLEQGALDKIEHFMSWVFKSEEEINQFRQSLAFANCNTTLKSIIANNKVDFTELENHFKWCAKGDLDVINKFKAKVPHLNFVEKLITELKEKDKYELLDEVLNWCFLNNQQQVAQFKRNMYKSGHFSYFTRSLTAILIKKDNSFKMLDRLISWFFTTEQEVQQFKTWALYPVCTDLLEEYQLQLADKFINWCDTSPEMINKFKNTLMLSINIEYILDPERQNTQTDLQLLIKWFSPSKETVQKFKTIISEENCPDNFYKLLDEFIESQNNLIVDDEKNVLQDLQDRHQGDGAQEKLTVGTIGEDSVTPLKHLMYRRYLINY